MKVACVSDLHGYLPVVPKCDLLIIAGDICPATDHKIPYQIAWLDTKFRSWLEYIERKEVARKVVGVAGNHDWAFQRAPEMIPKDLLWTYLEDSGVEWEGLKIWGSPWSLFFNNWAFNAPEEKGEKFLKEKYAKIPDDTNIIISHGPPKGYGDISPEGENVGSVSLLNRIIEVRPTLVCCGHLHSGKGQYEIEHFTNTVPSASLVVNGAYVGEDYRPQGSIRVVKI